MPLQNKVERGKQKNEFKNELSKHLLGAAMHYAKNSMRFLTESSNDPVCFPHFEAEETEDQRSDAYCPKS